MLCSSEIVLDRFKDSSTCLLAAGDVGEAFMELHHMTLLEEICHWRRALIVYIFSPLQASSFSFTAVVEDVMPLSLLLPQHLASLTHSSLWFLSIDEVLIRVSDQESGGNWILSLLFEVIAWKKTGRIRDFTQGQWGSGRKDRVLEKLLTTSPAFSWWGSNLLRSWPDIVICKIPV